MNLVVGGAGYIGSHTVKRLVAAGEDVVVYDDLSSGHARAVDDVPLVKGALMDTALLRRTMKEYGVEAVIHFAAFCYVGESVEKPLAYYLNNVSGTFSLLEAMEAEGVKTIIFSSSAATYGVPGKVPITEDAPFAPINPYGRTKAAVEKALADMERAGALRYVALRYFNAAGADVEGKLGEWHDPETHLIPLAVASALGRRDGFVIFGDGYDTPDGTCVRDYIHVDDLAEAHVLALSRLRGGCESGAFNLGNGKGFSIRQVIDTVRKVAGLDFPVTVGPPRPGDPPVLVADAARARSDLCWSPRYGDLETIVATAYRWLASHPRGYES